MNDYLNQIQTSIDSNLYYVALFASLALPDICGAIDAEDGQATAERYRAWFDKYVAPKYRSSDTQFLTGEDCYFFRCSLLHQGSSQHPRSTYSRVLFVEPTATSNVFHCNVMNDALNIDVRIFCSDFISSAAPMVGRGKWHRSFQEKLQQIYETLSGGHRSIYCWGFCNWLGCT